MVLLGQLLTTSHNLKNSLGKQAMEDSMKTKVDPMATTTEAPMVALHHLEATALRTNTNLPATLLV